MALESSAAHHFIKALASTLPLRPQAIVIVSAHWMTARPTLSLAEKPETIHDFSGFPEALYRLQYQPQGAGIELYPRLKMLLPQLEVHATRGLDHGAWVPLMLMYPAADIPVVQLSVQPKATPRDHYQQGLALSALRGEGVLLIGSGSFTHNLYELGHYQTEPRWSSDFRAWMLEKLKAADIESLLEYRTRAPEAQRNHPTDEHLLPLFFALGAGGVQVGDSAAVHHLHSSTEMAMLAMDSFAFGAP